MDILGGDISVASEPGQGSAFQVSLMLSSVVPTTAVVAAERCIHGYDGEQRSLMVIDDDPTHRRLIGDMLEPLGFAVVEAPDAATGLALVDQYPPDLFLLDVAMPGMDGWQLAAMLRARLPRTPIVMVSADAREGLQGAAAPVVHDGYLIKPVRLQSLLETLGSSLGLTWRYRSPRGVESKLSDALGYGVGLPERDRDELCRYAEIGYAKGLSAKLDALAESPEVPVEFIAGLRRLVGEFEFRRIIRLLGRAP